MTSILQEVELAKIIQQLWVVLLPTVAPPEPTRILWWIDRFDEKAIERGIRRAASKFAKTNSTMTPLDCYNYAQSVAKHETEEQTRKKAIGVSDDAAFSSNAGRLTWIESFMTRHLPESNQKAGGRE